MGLRVLIIDDHAEFRALLRHHITVRWPAAEFVDHDPSSQPEVPAALIARNFDIVLLDYQLGTTADGFDYLKRFRAEPGFPPVIMLTASGNEELAVKAIRGGAADYIPKQAMSHERLTGSILNAIESRRAEEPASAPGAAVSLPSDLQIDGYKLTRCIAQGAGGNVYLAIDSAGKELVIKVMAQRLPSGEESKEAMRLTREYDMIRRVNSPRVVKIRQLGIAQGHIFLAMEYFSQGSLREFLKGPIPAKTALDFVRQIAEALHLIHQAGILHRDLKPANVMRRADGSLALIDFGTAKQIGQTSDLTQVGSVIGTPHYMSPEQCAGEELTPASDVYSLGIMLYEMLTGQLPYTAATPLAVLYKHQYAPLPQLPRQHHALQPLLETLIAKNVDERCPRARDVLTFLDTL